MTFVLPLVTTTELVARMPLQTTAAGLLISLDGYCLTHRGTYVDVGTFERGDASYCEKIVSILNVHCKDWDEVKQNFRECCPTLLPRLKIGLFQFKIQVSNQGSVVAGAF